MKYYSRIILVFFSLMLFTSCSSGDKCNEAVSKLFDLTIAYMQDFSYKPGADQDKQKKLHQDLIQKARKEFESKHEPMVNACKEELAERPELVETLDCLIAAENIEALEKCPGEGKVKFVDKVKFN